MAISATISAQFLALAEKQETTVPLMIGHRIMGRTLLGTGDITESRMHCDRTLTLYNLNEHRSLAMRFGQDTRVADLSVRAVTLWLLGYPDAAIADAEYAVKDARELGQAATLMFALGHAPLTYMLCRDYTAANKRLDESIFLADERAAVMWKTMGMMYQGCVSALTGKASNAIQTITSVITAFRSSGSTLWMPSYFSHLAHAHAELGQFDDSWRYIDDALKAVKTTKEKWNEAEIHRMAGEIALMSPEPDAVKAEAYFERALAIAREQQAKSWELRAAMSMARLWCQRGKPQEARDLLAPVYSWFTEGFDTLDLKEAKALLDELASWRRIVGQQAPVLAGRSPNRANRL